MSEAEDGEQQREQEKERAGVATSSPRTQSAEEMAKEQLQEYLERYYPELANGQIEISPDGTRARVYQESSPQVQETANHERAESRQKEAEFIILEQKLEHSGIEVEGSIQGVSPQTQANDAHDFSSQAPEMTFEALDRDPWNALILELPNEAPPELYSRAARTADKLGQMVHQGQTDEAEMPPMPFPRPISDDDWADLGMELKGRYEKAMQMSFDAHELAEWRRINEKAGGPEIDVEKFKHVKDILSNERHNDMDSYVDIQPRDGGFALVRTSEFEFDGNKTQLDWTKTLAEMHERIIATDEQISEMAGAGSQFKLDEKVQSNVVDNSMPEEMTIDAIERDPWNAIFLELPKDASAEFYEEVARTARELRYTPHDERPPMLMEPHFDESWGYRNFDDYVADSIKTAWKGALNAAGDAHEMAEWQKINEEVGGSKIDAEKFQKMRDILFDMRDDESRSDVEIEHKDDGFVLMRKFLVSGDGDEEIEIAKSKTLSGLIDLVMTTRELISKDDDQSSKVLERVREAHAVEFDFRNYGEHAEEIEKMQREALGNAVQEAEHGEKAHVEPEHEAGNFLSGWFIAEGFAERLARAVDIAWGAVSSFFVSDPAMTAHQVHNTKQASAEYGNLEAQDARQYAGKVADRAEEHENMMRYMKSDQQETDMRLAEAMNTTATAEANLDIGPTQRIERGRHM